MSLYTNTKNSLPLPSPNNLIMTSQTCHDDEASDDEASDDEVSSWFWGTDYNIFWLNTI